MKLSLSKLGAAVLLAAFALTLASCGRRGALEPPPGAAASNAPLTGTPGEAQPPTPGELPGQTTANSSSAAAPAQAGSKQIPPHVPKPFPLDPLL